ncbi:MAG TPA: P1 family peptidase, partial [Candidatus Dormibacteraeota bacterium]|nr:P1 family peptidase [Candidatus Dormibacteraeota bacterium]
DSGRDGGLTDVPGFRVGHATDARGLTGCTVILCGEGAVPGIDVRGMATGLRDPGPCDPGHLVPAVHALFLSGGSAYGLDAAAGVMSYLEERRVGFRLREAVVPIVPAAILFDLSVGDPRARPGPAMARRACRNASAAPVPQGNVGAGTGATVGKLRGITRAMKAGLGSASVRRGALVVGALAVVNAWGDVLDPENGRIVAGLRDSDRGTRRIGMAAALRDGTLRTTRGPGRPPKGRLTRRRGDPDTGGPPGVSRVPTSTTLGVVATNARLGKIEASAVARLAQVAYARCISPVGTRFDGDVIFCLSRGEVQADSLVVGMLAIEALQAAILRAAVRARGLPGLPAARELDAV